MEFRSKEELRLIIEHQIRTLLKCSIDLRNAIGEERAKSLLSIFSATMTHNLLVMRHSGGTRQMLTMRDEPLIRKYASRFTKHYNETVHSIAENIGLPITLSIGKDETAIYLCSDYITKDLLKILNGEDDFCIHTDTVVSPDGQIICNSCGDEIDF